MYQGVRKSKIYRPSGAVLLLRLDTDVKLLTDLKEVSFFFFFLKNRLMLLVDLINRFTLLENDAQKIWRFL